MRYALMSLVLTVVSASGLVATTFVQDQNEMRTNARKLLQENNQNEALQLFQKLILDTTSTDQNLAEDWKAAVSCLVQLNRVNEFDQLLEETVQLHSRKWRLLTAVASSLNGEVPPEGFLIAGEFERGYHRGGGKYVSSADRDRVRALQLILQALPVVMADDGATAQDKANVLKQLADRIGAARYGEAWKLQDLTDLSNLPDYDEQQQNRFHFDRGMGGPNKGAPVDAGGNPVLHQLPASWEAAKTDGERWRWALDQVAKTDAERLSETELEWADFLHSQFGVSTAVIGPIPVIDLNTANENQADATDNKPVDSGNWAAHLLSDEETIARLASGVRRFTLPEEFNHVAIYKRVAARKDSKQRIALDALVNVRMNRHQYSQAVELLRSMLPLAISDDDRNELQIRLDQIEKNWIQFEDLTTQPAGKGATLEIRFRNGSQAAFQASPIKIDLLLNDIREYLQSNPTNLEYDRLQIENVGYLLISRDREKYVDQPVAQWTTELTPPEGHFDARQTISTPLQKAGAYWVTAKISEGNEARMVVWLADLAITRKPVDQGTLYYVADAVTGSPVARADLEFFGWKHERVGQTARYQVLTSRHADRTDAQGLCIPASRRVGEGYQWLTIARTADGRMAFHGFTHLWNPNRIADLDYSPVKVYSITDRPVYRPGHEVKFRLWVRQPRFHEDDARFANKKYWLQIRNPKGDVVFEKETLTDRWAGMDGAWTIPADATLGNYSLMVCNDSVVPVTRMQERNGQMTPVMVNERGVIGQGTFVVEEYRKPEYEVKIDQPEKPVMLGEKIPITIKASYYFGAPVTQASVHYKIERTKKDSRWYPIARWDWLYSPGYWWFAPSYSWYPGWERWGCSPPIPPWWNWNPDPPEVVAEGDAQIGEDGTFAVEVDTIAALQNHGDSDHNYSITAEVTDQSRRTIIGTGSVLVARDPFKVFVWTDRGHYQTGDTVNLGFQARTPDGKPVNGTGKAVLYSVKYDGDKPVETELQSWDASTDVAGSGTLKMVMPKSGQFRIAVTITDTEGHKQEGGCVLFVRGQTEDGRTYRFNDLELITDKRDYQPGDMVRLQINTNRADSTVLLFVRPVNGICSKPVVLKLQGKSIVHELKIERKDMPNIFVEALTIADGRMHAEIREIVVPPEQRVADVQVLPSAERYRPGQEATVRLKLTDINGKPFVGNTVLSVYDASLEYIAASSIPEIRSFFWNVRRYHNLYNESTLQLRSGPLQLPGEVPMQPLFGTDPSLGGPGFPMGGRMMFARGMAMAPAGGAPMAMSSAEEMGAPMAKGAVADAMFDTGAAPQAAPVTVRSNFADTAWWVASAESDADGIVEVKFRVPDNLTTWKVKAWAMGDGTRVGSGSADIISSKDLIIRPQVPRFLTEKDQITLSAVVHNYLKSDAVCQVVLESEGGLLKMLDSAEQQIQIEAGGERRVDWKVQVVASGTAKVRMKALSREESDAAELSVPVYVHGILKTDSYTGVIRPNGESAKITVNVPAERIEEQSRLEIRYSPSLAGAMVDALPYLIEFPYGCTEQTLNRFLPAVITQRTLQRMGINLGDVQKKRTNLNAQEIGDAATRAAQWQRYARNPVFDETEMNRIIQDSVKALTDMQLSDGGWGWFSGYGEHSSAHMTSQVVHGLTLAVKNDVPVLPDVIQRGVEWLKNYQAEQLTLLREGDQRRDAGADYKSEKRFKMKADNMDAFVAFVLAQHDGLDKAMSDYLYRDRGDLSVYAKALTGLVLDVQQDIPRRDMLLRNIEQFLEQDDENQTAWLRMPQDSWWYWYGSENEAMARYLQLMLKATPQSEVAPRLVKYLLNNRKHGTYWNSTRDTALVVEAMADYLAVSGEDKPDMTIEVLVDGTLQKRVKITADNFFSFDNLVLLEGDAVKTGEHQIEIWRTGKGPVYFNAYLTNFTKEDAITAAGLEVKVQRRFYRLERDDKDVSVQGQRGQVVKQQTAKYKRIPLENLQAVLSGDLVEVELIVESKNDYEYLMLEDRKPSGFEPDDQRSGYVWEGLRAYRELRDERVTFFLSDIARGQHSVSYRLRAETPSQQVSALPARILGMYAPELVGNSDEFRLQVQDRE